MFFPLAIDVPFNDDDANSMEMYRASELNSNVYNSLRTLVSVEAIENVMIGYKFDEISIIGKINISSLQSALDILHECEQIINKQQNDQLLLHHLIEISNNFYSLVPDSNGLNRLPVIDSIKMVKQKRAMIDRWIKLDAVPRAFIFSECSVKLNLFDVLYGRLGVKIDFIP